MQNSRRNNNQPRIPLVETQPFQAPERDADFAALLRAKVQEPVEGQDEDKVVRVRLWNGQVLGTRDYFVSKAGDHDAGDEVYIFRPRGGTDAEHDDKPVVWREAGGGGARVKWGRAISSWTSGNIVSLEPVAGQTDDTPTGEDAVTAYIVSPVDAVPENVGIEANDILGYLPVGENLGLLMPVKQGGGAGADLGTGQLYDCLQIVSKPDVYAFGPIRLQ